MKFWNWIRNEDTGQRELWLDGVIAEESWWGDEVTPAIFKEELTAGSGPILIHINSPGGDCIAASQIYTMLMDYPGDVTVQIDALAASAASVIAMAGTHVQMSPTALMMVHNPWTTAMGDSDDMRRAIQLLDEVKESIINAYQIKTGLSRQKLGEIMDAETWFNAYKARELGFCDEVLYEDEAAPEKPEKPDFLFSARTATLQLVNRLRAALPQPEPEPKPEPEPDTPELTDTAETQAGQTAEPAPDSAGAAGEGTTDTQGDTIEQDDRVKADDLMKRLLLLK